MRRYDFCVVCLNTLPSGCHCLTPRPAFIVRAEKKQALPPPPAKKIIEPVERKPKMKLGYGFRMARMADANRDVAIDSILGEEDILVCFGSLA